MAFKIPDKIMQLGLPSQTLSVSAFLEFKRPEPKIQYKTEDFYLTEHLSDTSIEDTVNLLSNPMPLPSVVNNILNCLKTTASSANMSIACLDVASGHTKFFPVWFVMYWQEIQSVWKAQHSWMLANQYLQVLSQRGSAKLKGLVGDVYDALSKLPWHGLAQGFEESHEITCLHIYVTNSWLQSTHEDQLLELLQQDLIKHQDNMGQVLVESTYFIRSLLLAFGSSKKRACKGYLHAKGQSVTRI